MAIERRPYSYDEAVSYRSRVYATFNIHSKHTCVAYIAENSQEQYHVGTTYNTVLQKWMRYLRK
jgi:hypothetical protein